MILNKNGFTLIELLAVVAIIALLATIVIPNVVKYYDEAETKSFISQSQYLYKAATQQFVQDRIKNGTYPNGIVYDNINNPLKLQSGGDNLVYRIKVNSGGDVSYMDISNGVWSVKVPENGDTSLTTAISMDKISRETLVAVGQEDEPGGGETPDPIVPVVNDETTNPDGTYNPNTPGIPNTSSFELLENETDWEDGCWANATLESGLDSERLNCKILDDNRKCEDLTTFCSDTNNYVNYYVQQPGTGIDYGSISSDTNGKGLYYTDSDGWDKDEGHRIFFYRGDVKNNYVKFAGTLWRIIRIDERGNIRMMKDEIDTSAEDYKTTWNTASSVASTAKNKKKMSFMYGTSTSSPYTPTNNSTIKMALDRIYGKNFDLPINQTWENFLSDPGYCNDKSGDTSPSEYTATLSGTRTISDMSSIYVDRKTQPTYKCKQEIDNYTTKTSTFGNKATEFKYPIAVITYDELIFAGGIPDGTNTSFYLSKPNKYWTLTPYKIFGDACVFSGSYYRNYCHLSYNNCAFHETIYYYEYYYNNLGKISKQGEGAKYKDYGNSCESAFSNNVEPASLYIYPVISLKPTVEFSLASETNPGTKDNPYIVGIDRTWVD